MPAQWRRDTAGHRSSEPDRLAEQDRGNHRLIHRRYRALSLNGTGQAGHRNEDGPIRVQGGWSGSHHGRTARRAHLAAGCASPLANASPAPVQASSLLTSCSVSSQSGMPAGVCSPSSISATRLPSSCWSIATVAPPNRAICRRFRSVCAGSELSRFHSWLLRYRLVHETSWGPVSNRTLWVAQLLGDRPIRIMHFAET